MGEDVRGVRVWVRVCVWVDEEGGKEVEVRGVEGRDGVGEVVVDGVAERGEGEVGSVRIHLKRVAATWKERADDILFLFSVSFFDFEIGSRVRV